MNRYAALTVCILNALPLLAQASLTPPKLRLPETVRPVSYSARLRLVPGQDRFEGRIEIHIDVREPVSTIWLNAKSLTLSSATLIRGSVTVPMQIQSAENDFVAFTAASTLNKGPALLIIQYAGDISRVLTDGAFQQKQGNDWYVFTKFEPVTARRVFPCFDEPSFKTPWQLNLEVPQQLRVFSNTPQASETKEAEGMKLVRFSETKPLPSYLVAFAAGPFDVVPTEPVGRNRHPSRIIVPRGRAPEAAYAASITPKLIEMLETYFGTPYPYEKLDQIVVPLTTAWGAMENAGLIAFGDFLLAPASEDSELQRRGRAITMEHEMSHQWFGDLVTMAWWNDIWLNEAFASWLSEKLVNQWEPEWNVKADTARSTYVMRADSLTTARKIRQPIEAPGDIANAFDGITYGKGEAVIGMFENYVGPEAFQKAVRLYLSKHAWGNATSSDLLDAIDAVSGPGNGAAFSTFLNQVGFPLIGVKLDCSGGMPQVALDQHRFVPAGSQGSAELWQAPVCIKWDGSPAGQGEQCVLLKDEAASFALENAHACPEWLFADANAAGYYAVDYEPKLAARVVTAAAPRLSPAENASALRNVQILFSAGLGDARQELESVRAFAASSDAGLVRQTVTTTAGISDLIPDDLREQYAGLIRTLYGTRARALGWNPKPGEAEEVHLLRMEVVPLVATRGQDQELEREASQLAREWLKDRKTLDPDMVVPVLSAAAWNGDQKFFELLVDQIKKTAVRRERQ